MVCEDKCVKPAMHLHDLIMLHACRTNLCIICNRVCACLSEQHMICLTRILRKPHSCQSCISGFLKGAFCLLKAQTKLVILAIVFLWLAGVIGASGSVLLHCEAARFSNTPVDPGVFQMHTRHQPSCWKQGFNLSRCGCKLKEAAASSSCCAQNLWIK